MSKDKKEDVDFKEMYGKPATLKVEELIKEQKINLENRVIYKKSR